jgi:hypothetical protein
MALEDAPSNAISEIGKIADRIGRQPPEARLLTFAIAAMLAYVPTAIFSTPLIALGVLVFAVVIVVLYIAVLRANREPPRAVKNQYDRIFQEYAPPASRAP